MIRHILLITFKGEANPDDIAAVRAAFLAIPHQVSGVLAVDRLLEGRQRFTAIFAANDQMACGAALGLHRRSLRVPEDVSLVGFDDLAWLYAGAGTAADSYPSNPGPLAQSASLKPSPRHPAPGSAAGMLHFHTVP